MKMCRVVLANILNVPKIRNIIEMSKFCRIFEAACEISDAPGLIKGNKEAVSMFCNISSERHFTKRLLFFLATKIASSAGFKKNVVYLAKMTGEIGDFVCSPYFDHFLPPSATKIRKTGRSDARLGRRSAADAVGRVLSNRVREEVKRRGRNESLEIKPQSWSGGARLQPLPGVRHARAGCRRY
jgi:hypothetical protein